MLLGALATLALATPRVAAAQIAPYCQPGQPPQFGLEFGDRIGFWRFLSLPGLPHWQSPLPRPSWAASLLDT